MRIMTRKRVEVRRSEFRGRIYITWDKRDFGWVFRGDFSWAKSEHAQRHLWKTRQKIHVKFHQFPSRLSAFVASDFVAFMARCSVKVSVFNPPSSSSSSSSFLSFFGFSFYDNGVWGRGYAGLYNFITFSNPFSFSFFSFSFPFFFFCVLCLL